MAFWLRCVNGERSCSSMHGQAASGHWCLRNQFSRVFKQILLVFTQLIHFDVVVINVANRSKWTPNVMFLLRIQMLEPRHVIACSEREPHFSHDFYQSRAHKKEAITMGTVVFERCSSSHYFRPHCRNLFCCRRFFGNFVFNLCTSHHLRLETENSTK